MISENTMDMTWSESQRVTTETWIASERPGLDDLTGPFALFIRGRETLGRQRGRFTSSPILQAADLRERNAASLMLIGRDLESVSMNEEIIRRYSFFPEAGDYVARAHFNAGCALLRVGLIDRAMDHFAVIIDNPETPTQGSLLPLACVGLHQGRLAMERIQGHKQRTRGLTSA